MVIPPEMIPIIHKMLQYLAPEVGRIAQEVFRPQIESRQAKADLIKARSAAEVSRVEAESTVTDAITLARGMRDVTQLLREMELSSEMRQAIVAAVQEHASGQLRNLLQIAQFAAADLEGGEDVEDYEPDAEWATHYNSNAKNVSQERLQKLWAKVLAQEVRNPGTTSRRTLTILKDLSREE
ncbi:MAG: DUF2806 domain-containing protein, partial [Chloroflexi bacterium]|nr:DUF2806 domain-containing protein [Chloroflexota bacterium]